MKNTESVEPGDAWETYWQQTSHLVAKADQDAASIWDADADLVAGRDLPHFRSILDPALPLIDLGCGSGIQTRYLARHFSRVIGVDISASAVELARSSSSAPNVEYRQLDVFDRDAVSKLRAELGDLNIYMRTLLHLVQPELRPALGEAIAALLGARGTLCLHELGAASHAYFGGWIERNGMPVGLQRVLGTGIRPGAVDREQVLAIFPPDRFTMVTDGETRAEPVHVRVVGSPPRLADEPWAPPSYFMVLKPRQ